MSSRSFDNYAAVASLPEADNTEVAGRYAFQAAAERRIFMDVVAKLQLGSEDTLLEIGCGPGNLLIPLSHLTATARGIDNEAALRRLAARVGPMSPIQLQAGDFMSLTLADAGFSKILVYSVLQYMSSLSEAQAFLRKAFTLLAPGGRLLVGDLPNRDKKRRFSSSPAGLTANADWQSRVAAAGAHPMATLPEDPHLVVVDDDFVASLSRLARDGGYESYLLEQPTMLPFGHTREDLLVVAPR